MTHHQLLQRLGDGLGQGFEGCDARDDLRGEEEEGGAGRGQLPVQTRDHRREDTQVHEHHG